MEHLFVCRIGRAADQFIIVGPRQVLDVRQSDIGLLALELVVLPSTHGRDMRRDAGIYDDVLLACMIVYVQPAQHEEAVAAV